jgi:glycosyltransferase involved in cell wall biosynthesis
MSSSETGSFPSLPSVVLCSHNGAATVHDQLAALANQTYAGEWELVFVDDASTDGSAAIAESWADRVPIRVVSCGLNGTAAGLARARNAGAEAARGDLLLFCDDDDVADPGWIQALVDAAPLSAVLGGFNEEERLNDPRIRGWRFAWTPGCLPVAFGVVTVPSGGNSAVWTDAFREVGGFDAEFSATGEEVDFYWRLHLAGHRARYVPEAIMHIRHRTTLSTLIRQSYRYGMGSAALFRRFRHQGLRQTSALQTLQALTRIARGIPKAVVFRRNRGAWLRMTSFACGQAVGSLRNRVWYVD